MRNLFRKMIVGALLSLSGPVVAGPLEDGTTAYSRKEYATALRLWRPLAEQGVGDLRFRFGVMYENGWGVLQDYTEALKWYRSGANQGEAGAQMGLGRMYEKGRGVPQNYVHAHMWLNLAAVIRPGERYGLGVAGLMRDELAKQMTSAQIAEAQRLAREWKPKPAD